jgi:hypothetical protein
MQLMKEGGKWELYIPSGEFFRVELDFLLSSCCACGMRTPRSKHWFLTL